MNTHCLDMEVLPDGHLKVILTPEGREKLTNLIVAEVNDGIIWKQDHGSTWMDLTESHWINSTYQMLEPHEIGALTSAPIIGYNISYNDKGEVAPAATDKVWWYPEYEVKDEFEELLNHGYIVFTKAPAYESVPQTES